MQLAKSYGKVCITRFSSCSWCRGGGDTRVDSTEHPAKYGFYGTIDLSNKILCIELVAPGKLHCKHDLYSNDLQSNKVAKHAYGT